MEKFKIAVRNKVSEGLSRKNLWYRVQDSSSDMFHSQEQPPFHMESSLKWRVSYSRLFARCQPSEGSKKYLGLFMIVKLNKYILQFDQRGSRKWQSCFEWKPHSWSGIFEKIYIHCDSSRAINSVSINRNIFHYRNIFEFNSLYSHLNRIVFNIDLLKLDEISTKYFLQFYVLITLWEDIVANFSSSPSKIKSLERTGTITK